MDLIDLGKHAVAATAIMQIVNVIQPLIFKDAKLKKFTPLVAIVFAIGYMMTPLAGLGEMEVTQKIMMGVIFGISLIGGRDALKNIKGDYAKPDAGGPTGS